MVAKKKTTKKTETNKRIFPTDIVENFCKTEIEEKINEIKSNSDNLNEVGNIKPTAFYEFERSFIDLIINKLNKNLDKKYNILSNGAKEQFLDIYVNVLKLYNVNINANHVRGSLKHQNWTQIKPFAFNKQQNKKILLPEDLSKTSGSFSDNDYAILEKKLPKIDDLIQESVEKKLELVEKLAADAYQEFLKAKRKMVMSRKMVDSFYNKFEKEDLSDDSFVNAENDLREKLISLLKN
jgi:hypothetical protein